MKKKRRSVMYRVTKVISTVLLGYLIVTVVMIGVGSLADDGVILDAWYAMVGCVPFGNILAPFCVDLFSESFNLGKNMSEYLIGIKGLTALDFFQDVVTVLLTAVFYEAVDNFVQVLMGIKERGGIHNVLMQMISGMVSVFLATIVAGVALNYLCQQLVLLPDIARGIISVLVTLITVSGAVGVIYFVLGMGIVRALSYVFLKLVLTNTLKVMATYTGALLVMLFLGEKAYLKMFSACAAWGVVIILLIGADLLISSVYEH